MPALEMVTLLSGASVPALACSRTMASINVWEVIPGLGAEILRAAYDLANGLEPELSEQMLDALAASGKCSARGVLHPAVVLVVKAALVLDGEVVSIVDPVAA